ncbi:hypothetical protein HYW83_02185 [Candidatus Peregrinibacteria bacterium]|nr:hypothetical protein [Candidatus Peregrinibacteria bacterium]
MQKTVLDTTEMRELFAAIAKLKTPREAKFFLRDLCTLAELKEMATRWQIAKSIKKDIPYRKIVKQTGASTATITRVANWLHHGMGGYRSMLQRLK